jgi:RNA polymerase sigma-70 factor (ECF subfamily)
MNPSATFEAIVNAHQNAVYSLAVRLLGSETEAQDIAQEVFLRAYQHFNEIVNSPSLGGWLRTVTRNLCLNHLSRYRFRWRFFSELTNEDESESSPENWAASSTPEADPDVADRRQMVQRALQQLPQAQRVALVLYHYENMNYSAIANRLGISLSKVKMDIFRGRIALRRQLRNDPDEGLLLSENRKHRVSPAQSAMATQAASRGRWAPSFGMPLDWCMAH